MSTTIAYLAAQQHIDDLRHEAQHHDLLREVQNNRDHVKVRRVAVIRPAGSHFELMTPRRLVRR